MSKRNSVSYIKPEEPNFIKNLKQQIGYKEPDQVETKKQILPPPDEEDLRDKEDEQPVVVVLKPGDLTAEEAEVFQVEKKEEELNTPADLTKPIVFRAKKRNSETDLPEKKRKLQKKNDRSKSLLSFDQDENEDD